MYLSWLGYRYFAGVLAFRCLLIWVIHIFYDPSVAEQSRSLPRMANVLRVWMAGRIWELGIQLNIETCNYPRPPLNGLQLLSGLATSEFGNEKN